MSYDHAKNLDDAEAFLQRHGSCSLGDLMKYLAVDAAEAWDVALDLERGNRITSDRPERDSWRFYPMPRSSDD